MNTKSNETTKNYIFVSAVGYESLVLYSTMSGYQLLEENKRYSEWESKLEFNSHEAAERKIKELIKANHPLIAKVQLQVLERTLIINTTDVFYDPIQSNNDVLNAKILNSRSSFELSYANGPSTDYSYPGDIKQLRSDTNYGYTNEKINKAFEQYLKMFNIID